MSDASTEGSVLVVFLRRPAPNIGKQRIAASLGAEATAELAGLLLDAALEDARDWPGPVALSPSEAADSDWAAELMEDAARIIAQPGGNLGRRINTVDQTLRANGARHTIYIGTDAPVLDSAYLAEARRALDGADVVLGPAEDGGVTLMGTRRGWPDLLQLPWETNELGEALERACVTQGLSVIKLGRRYDVDTQQDLARIYEDLRDDPRPARRGLIDWIAGHGDIIET